MEYKGGLYFGETTMFSNIKGNTSYHNKMLHKVIRCIASDRQPGELEMGDSDVERLLIRCGSGQIFLRAFPRPIYTAGVKWNNENILNC